VLVCRHEIARLLLNAGADARVTLRDGGTPLLAASYKGHYEMVRVLIEYGASVNASREDGLTPLCQAAKSGHATVVDLLLGVS